MCIRDRTVKVKVMSISPEGKIALSIKRTEPRPPRPQRADTGCTWQPRTQSQPQGEMSFEDMMSPVSYTHLDVYKRQDVVQARKQGVDDFYAKYADLDPETAR